MDKIKTELSILTDMLIVLIILSAVSIYYYGARAMVILLLSVLTCITADMLCHRIRHIKSEGYDILSSFETGLVLGLMMSAAVPYYVLVTADIFAIVICKHSFGGRGHEIFNSAAAAFLFASLCFSGSMLVYPKPFDYIGLGSSAITDASLFSSMTKTFISTDAPSASIMDMFIGKFNGPMGTGATIILLISAVFLALRRSVSAISFFTQLAIVAGYTFIYSRFSLEYTLSNISGGMLIFGMIFLSCDYRTIPKTKSSRFIYGVIMGVLVLVFRFYANVENAVIYAVIIAAPFGIELDKRSVSFAEILSKEKSGIFVKLKRRFNKNLNHVGETLTLINGSDNNGQQSHKFTIHRRNKKSGK